MNKSDLTKIVAEKTGLTLKTSEAAINALVDAMSDSLTDGQSVRISGFGTFNVKVRAARIGRNPKTKEKINIPPTRTPVFKPGASLKTVVGSKGSAD